MTEAEWLACQDILSLQSEVPAPRTSRKARLFLCECCQPLMALVTHPESRTAVELAEQYAEGVATREVLERTYQSARRAVNVPAGAALDRAFVRVANPGFGVTEEANAILAAAGDASPDQAALFRDIFGNPFRPVTFSPVWRTDTALALARQMYDAREFSAMPILADALQDAGCDNDDILNHCRGPGPHVRGCWVVDLVLGKE